MRKNKDFSASPVWDDELNRYLVDITYPDQSRKRKRFKSLKKAQGFWAREATTIEEGTWNNNFVPKNVTLGQAFDRTASTAKPTIARIARRNFVEGYRKRIRQGHSARPNHDGSN